MLYHLCPVCEQKMNVVAVVPAATGYNYGLTCKGEDGKTCCVFDMNCFSTFEAAAAEAAEVNVADVHEQFRGDEEENEEEDLDIYGYDYDDDYER